VVLPPVAARAAATWTQGASLPGSYVTHWDVAYAYYPPLHEVVLFGGSPKQTTESWSNQTWVYRSGTWSRGPNAPAGLTPRGGGAMAYDPVSQRIVMFGGSDGSWPPSNQTWLFDGTQWTPGPAAPPAMDGRTGAEMAYDDALGTIVLFGGSGALPYSDTWLYDGATNSWSQGPPTPSAVMPRSFFGMAYDPVQNHIVITGGDGGFDTWFFDGATWTQGPDEPSTMGPRDRFRMAYDPQLGGVTVFGGMGYLGSRHMWVLVGGAWTNIKTGKTGWPSNRVDGDLLWNPDANALMLFAGIMTNQNGKAGFTDTWFFAGTPPTPAAPVAPSAPPTLPPPSTQPYVPPSGPSNGTLSAHDGQFWLDGNPVILKGANDTSNSPKSEVQQLASFGMNLVRLRVRWAQLEPTAPTSNGDGTWTHHWSTTYLSSLDTYLSNAHQAGLYVVLDIHGCDPNQCGFFGQGPEWSYTAPYDSTGINYPHTPQGKAQAQADFWTDSLRTSFYEQMWTFLVQRYASSPGIAGYEVMNEPQPGTLPNAHSTTQLILDGELQIAQTAIRPFDPTHVIFFTTREDYGPGLRQADLSGWAAMGNVAFDLHEYFGARWGVGLDLINPNGQTYGEALGNLYEHVATGTSSGNFSYLGSTLEAIRYLRDRESGVLAADGIPVWVGEIGTRFIDLGVNTYWGSVTAAANYLGLSWTVDNGPFGFVGQSWQPMVLAAIAAPG
jgi:hypothetical protein